MNNYYTKIIFYSTVDIVKLIMNDNYTKIFFFYSRVG